MQFSTLIIATLAAVASASPAVKRQADCAEVDQIPECGVSLKFTFQENGEAGGGETPQL